jgi:hypothetical protein
MKRFRTCTSIGVLFLLAVFLTVGTVQQPPLQGGLVWSSKCGNNVACKDLKFDPTARLFCYDKNGAQIPNCTCALDSTNVYQLCNYTGNAGDVCGTDENTLKKCHGTYTPPGGGQPQDCWNFLFECTNP